MRGPGLGRRRRVYDEVGDGEGGGRGGREERGRESEGEEGATGREARAQAAEELHRVELREEE